MQPAQSAQSTHAMQAAQRAQRTHAIVAAHAKSPAPNSVSALNATPALPAVAALPATATLPAVAALPATAALANVAALPATAALLAVAALPATATLRVVAMLPAVAWLSLRSAVNPGHRPTTGPRAIPSTASLQRCDALAVARPRMPSRELVDVAGDQAAPRAPAPRAIVTDRRELLLHLPLRHPASLYDERRTVSDVR